MIDRLKAALRGDGRIDDWKLVETVKSGVEWYLSGQALDTTRSVETKLYSLVVYVDGVDAAGGKTRGAYATTLPPTSSKAELTATIERSVRAAGGMRNPWYSLPEASSVAEAQPRSGFDGKSLSESMSGLRSALYEPEAANGAKINSLELFLSRKATRIVNSRGVDVAWSSYFGYAEFIVNASAAGREEIELFGDIEFSEPDYGRLSQAVALRLRQAADRLDAVPTPAVEGMPVLFREELAARLYGYWFAQAQAQAAYEKTAAFSLGDSIGASGDGDLVELTAVPYIKGNPHSAPYDVDGQALVPLPCITGGTLKALSGPVKYTRYLGLADSGELPLFELASGTAAAAGLEAGSYLEAAAFSDFFVDGTTGDFGGELRLGYLVKDGKRQAVRGGSITGSMVDNRGRVKFSRELETFSNCRGPAVCLVPLAFVSQAE
ncbi:MAG: hypothetical protein A2Y38_11590 [Spirochaetes bacterium GWB1_59_5]|nr:MAG: hypothetical protein A2Y38_11590 [Spirochaetes bacterium GWB1_59_5]